MSDRTFVVIFFFWALLTIITPTLVLLSENSKAETSINETGPIMMPRRMMDSMERHPMTTSLVVPDAEASAAVPAPAVAPIPSFGIGRSNGTDFEILSLEQHVKIVQKLASD